MNLVSRRFSYAFRRIGNRMLTQAKPNLSIIRRRTFYTVKTELPPLVTCDWLESQLSRENVKIVDGSWHMANSGRNGAKEFSQERIPGSTFFDLNEIYDKRSKIPRMMPSTQEFEVHMSEIGVTRDDIIIVYDSEMFSSPRVWYMLKAFGAKNVSILDGGFKLWKQLNKPIETGAMTGTYQTERRAFNAKLSKMSIASISDIYRVLTGVDQDSVIVDARSYKRWAGYEEDPYKDKLGTVPGHIPGSYNVPYKELLKENTIEWRDWQTLRNIFDIKGIEIDTKSVISSCGSGVTACFINFAIHLIQWNEFKDESDYRPPLRLYDGSWAEWGSRADTPKKSLAEGEDERIDAHGVVVRG